MTRFIWVGEPRRVIADSARGSAPARPEVAEDLHLPRRSKGADLGVYRSGRSPGYRRSTRPSSHSWTHSRVPGRLVAGVSGQRVLTAEADLEVADA